MKSPDSILILINCTSSLFSVPLTRMISPRFSLDPIPFLLVTNKQASHPVPKLLSQKQAIFISKSISCLQLNSPILFNFELALSRSLFYGIDSTMRDREGDINYAIEFTCVAQYCRLDLDPCYWTLVQPIGSSSNKLSFYLSIPVKCRPKQVNERINAVV